MLVPAPRTSVDLRRRNEWNIDMYLLKADVVMLNTVKTFIEQKLLG